MKIFIRIEVGGKVCFYFSPVLVAQLQNELNHIQVGAEVFRNSWFAPHLVDGQVRHAVGRDVLFDTRQSVVGILQCQFGRAYKVEAHSVARKTLSELVDFSFVIS